MPHEEQSYYATEAEDVLTRLETNLEQGLSSSAATKRRQQSGPNLLEQAQRRSAWRILLDQFKSIVIVLMLAAAALALVTARWPEAIALVAVAVVNTAIGFVSEWKAIRSMEALRELGKAKSRVRRDGEEQEIEAENIVPGDIALLNEEMLVPADIRLCEAAHLRVNEASLTGESVPVNKTAKAVADDAPLAERTSMLYKGTSVTEGTGVGVVVATGMQT